MAHHRNGQRRNAVPRPSPPPSLSPLSLSLSVAPFIRPAIERSSKEEGPDTDLAQAAGSVGRPLPRLAEQGEAVAVADGKAEELGRRGGGGIYP